MLNWQDGDFDGDIKAIGCGKRRYVIFNEGSQYIFEVDGSAIGYGDFEDCKNQAEEYDKACRRK